MIQTHPLPFQRMHPPTDWVPCCYRKQHRSGSLLPMSPAPCQKPNAATLRSRRRLSHSLGCATKFSDYVLGKVIALETDHKPLVPLLGTKQLNNLPPRVLRFRLRLDRFDYTIAMSPANSCTSLTRSLVHR